MEPGRIRLLLDHYIDALRKLGKTSGILGDVYAGAQSRFNNRVNVGGIG